MQKYRARHVNTSICLASLEPKYTHAKHTENDVIFKKSSNEFENVNYANPVNSIVPRLFKTWCQKPLWVPDERFDTILGFNACYPFKFSQTLKTEHKKNSLELQCCRFLVCYFYYLCIPFHVA